MEILLYIVLPLVFVGGLLAVRSQNRGRRDALKKVAEERKYKFYLEDTNDGILKRLYHLQFFQLGAGPAITNILKGKMQKTLFFFFDFSYHTGGRHPIRHDFTAVVFTSSENGFPLMQLRPKRWSHAYDIKGLDELNFDSHREFSKHYKFFQVWEGEEKTHLSLPALHHLDDTFGWYVEAENHLMLLARKAEPQSPNAVKEFLDEAWKVREVFATGKSS